MLSALASFAAGSTVRGSARRLPTPGESFPKQWGYESCDDLNVAVCCSRRSGKTRGAVRKAARILITKPGAWCHFVSLIKRNAKKHFFRPLMAELDRLGYKGKYHSNESDLTIRLWNGSWVQALGVDDIAGCAAVQGDRSDWFCVDECHLPREEVLEHLIDVATPMLTDTGGQLELLGLPPEVEDGYFDRILSGGRFTVFSWTMFDHDFPRPRELKLADVQKRCADRGLAIEVIETVGDDGRPHYEPGPGTHVQVLRQYFGVRVIDAEKLAYEYQPGRNDYDPAAVDFTAGTRRHSMGIDLGFSDRDAIVVTTWDKDDATRRLYVRFAWQRSHNDVDDLALVVAVVRSLYRPGVTVGDTGGHGATKVMETLKNRLGFEYQQKPPDVMVSVGLVNDDLRTGRLLLPTRDMETTRVIEAGCVKYADRPAELERFLDLMKGDQPSLSRELQKVTRSVNPTTKKVEINKRGHHSDLSESLRYSHAGARAFAAKAPQAVPSTRAEIREAAIQAQQDAQRRRGVSKW